MQCSLFLQDLTGFASDNYDRRYELRKHREKRYKSPGEIPGQKAQEGRQRLSQPTCAERQNLRAVKTERREFTGSGEAALQKGNSLKSQRPRGQMSMSDPLCMGYKPL